MISEITILTIHQHSFVRLDVQVSVWALSPGFSNFTNYRLEA